VGINPKVCNLVKGYDTVRGELVWILDSNVHVVPWTLDHAVACFEDPRVGLVHHVPCAVQLNSMGALLDGAFLSCTHARVYTFINALAVASCIIGKSNLFRKADLDVLGGIQEFGGYMSEDNVLGIAIMGLGKRHVIAPTFAYQSMGNVSLWDFLVRRARWIRVRKYTVTSATLYEPFTESIVCGLLGAACVSYFVDLNQTWFFCLHMMGWFLCDMWIAYWVYSTAPTPFRLSPRDVVGFVFAWILRECIALVVYAWAIVGNEISWRHTRYILYRDGSVAKKYKN
jgi:ceramide glucosyltransferase